MTDEARETVRMLIDDIRDDMKAAMKAKDAVTLRTLRSVIAAVQEAQTAGKEAIELDDAGVEKVIAAQAKMRTEAADAYDEGGRTDQAASERKELAVLERYLPEKLSDDELDALIDRVLADNGFSEKAQMGQAMKAVNAEVAGRAEGRVVADKVKGKLT